MQLQNGREVDECSAHLLGSACNDTAECYACDGQKFDPQSPVLSDSVAPIAGMEHIQAKFEGILGEISKRDE